MYKEVCRYVQRGEGQGDGEMCWRCIRGLIHLQHMSPSPTNVHRYVRKYV
jgi:hypothetical protein